MGWTVDGVENWRSRNIDGLENGRSRKTAVDILCILSFRAFVLVDWHEVRVWNKSVDRWSGGEDDADVRSASLHISCPLESHSLSLSCISLSLLPSLQSVNSLEGWPSSR